MSQTSRQGHNTNKMKRKRSKREAKEGGALKGAMQMRTGLKLRTIRKRTVQTRTESSSTLYPFHALFFFFAVALPCIVVLEHMHASIHSYTASRLEARVQIRAPVLWQLFVGPAPRVHGCVKKRAGEHL